MGLRTTQGSLDWRLAFFARRLREFSDVPHVVDWLTPVSVVQPVRATERSHCRLLQHNKRFEPGLLVVPVGSVVDFPNADPWFHNGFSLYRGKRFDRGLWH